MPSLLAYSKRIWVGERGEVYEMCDATPHVSRRGRCGRSRRLESPIENQNLWCSFKTPMIRPNFAEFLAFFWACVVQISQIYLSFEKFGHVINPLTPGPDTGAFCRKAFFVHFGYFNLACIWAKLAPIQSALKSICNITACMSFFPLALHSSCRRPEGS